MEAMFYSQLKDKKVQCMLCPHHCKIDNQKSGRCNVRKNFDGVLVALNYGKISALCIDPIEKKPLHLFYPGSHIVSVGSFGCNMACAFCQNHSISQEYDLANEINNITVQDIIKYTKNKHLASIALTYNEPTVFFEWALAICKEAKQEDLRTVLVTNGFIEEAPFSMIAPYIDAMNIDIKAPSEDKYTSLGGQLEPVLHITELAKKMGIYVEITCLLVPDLFDDLDECSQFFRDLHERIGDTYIHLSRYFPRYKYEKEATSIQMMLDIKECALHYFSQVSLGNVE